MRTGQERSGRPRRRRAERLDPVRWSPRRRARLFRVAAVAALLLLAAGVLATGGRAEADGTRCPARAAPRPSRTAAPGGRVPTGSVGLAVPVTGVGGAGLAHPGDHVDVTVTAPDADTAEVLVRGALVLRGTTGQSADTEGGSVVYLAMTEQQARRVAGVDPAARIGLTLRPG